MTDQTEISVREVEQDLAVICSFLKSPVPDRNIQGAPKLGTLMKRLGDSAALRTKGGAQIYDLLVRARENLRIGCVDDALAFLTQARDSATMGSSAAGEKAE
jgi:hypothetical protein